MLKVELKGLNRYDIADGRRKNSPEVKVVSLISFCSLTCSAEVDVSGVRCCLGYSLEPGNAFVDLNMT